jgi:hypothetical protein
VYVSRARVAAPHPEKAEQAEESKPTSLRSAAAAIVVARLRVTEIALSTCGRTIPSARSPHPIPGRSCSASTSTTGLTSNRTGCARACSRTTCALTTSGARLRMDHRDRRGRADQHQISPGREFRHFRSHEHLLHPIG